MASRLLWVWLHKTLPNVTIAGMGVSCRQVALLYCPTSRFIQPLLRNRECWQGLLVQLEDLKCL